MYRTSICGETITRVTASQELATRDLFADEAEPMGVSPKADTTSAGARRAVRFLADRHRSWCAQTISMTASQLLASLGEGGVHDQTKFGVQAAVSAAFVN